MKKTYHAQIGKARRSEHALTIIRGLRAETRHIQVEASDLTEARKKAEALAKSWSGEWRLDGHPKQRGGTQGMMIG